MKRISFQFAWLMVVGLGCSSAPQSGSPPSSPPGSSEPHREAVSPPEPLPPEPPSIEESPEGVTANADVEDSRREPVPGQEPGGESVVDEGPTSTPWSSEGLTEARHWPYYQWDSARAYVFNLETAGPKMNMYAWRSDRGLNKSAREIAKLESDQGRKIASLVRRGKGEIIVSKCPFPRHGVVFYSGDTPVGSVSVCFECGDILVWPADRKGSRESWPKKEKRYKKVYPKWQAFFRDDLGIPLAWKEIKLDASQEGAK